MSVYVVTWNLNQERSNYGNARQAFIQQIERYDNVKDSGLETVRWISTSSTASQVDTDLRRNLDQNDRLFVSKLNPNENHGWLSQKTWDWINARL